jgi:hypothetical protein
VLGVALLAPLLLLLARVTVPLGGSHYFRQAHVAANIDRFVEGGLSLRPATYNDDVPYAAYDFPLYQLAVAGTSRLTAADPLRAARGANLILLVAMLVLLDRLLAHAGARRATRAVTLILFAWAPLLVFCFHAPMVDDLALLLALLSLERYAHLERKGGGLGARATMLASGFLSTLIKSPVYLPVLVAVLWHRARTRGPRALLRGDSAALLATSALGVLCFKVYWMTVNGVSDPLTPYERGHYFGTIAGRLSPGAWTRVASDLWRFTAGPVVALLAVAGVLYRTRRPRGTLLPLLAGSLIGCGVTLIVFFGLFPPHNYYQLPFVLPLAVFAGQALHGCRVLARAGRRFGRPALRIAQLALPLSLLLAGPMSWAAFHDLAANRVADVLRARGEWIHAHTSRDDYVVYLIDGDTDDWDPAYLYFAGREGRNLPLGRATGAELAAVGARGRPRPVLVFTFREEGQRLLRRLGYRVVAVEDRRGLFRLEAAVTR